MLDRSALNQLKDFKKQIRDSVKRSRGIVKGTSKRFGFVIDESDGQQYLLPQTEMDQLLPGDYIQFTLQDGNQTDQSGSKKPIAKTEKLLKPELCYFTGQIKAKNQQLFVIPDHPQLSRWVFIPPKYRKNINEGDLVSARISQHPYNNKGRVQAAIEAVLGQPNDPYIEHRYAIAKQGIAEKIWGEDELKAIRQTSERSYEQALTDKTDLREKLFFTIDGPSTQDMDDALCVEPQDDGWLLSVAIADASSFVTPGSPLDKIASRQAASIYLPGQKVPMLPDVLASDLCSLRPGHDRLAVVCRMHINPKGVITAVDYMDSVINSKARLNFEDVSRFLESGEAETNYSAEIKAALTALQALSASRRQWRETHSLVNEDYPDYRLVLDERGKISRIERTERNIAQQIIEECMLACNEATAGFLQQHLPDAALFLRHDGFKTDQLPGISKLLEAYFPDYSAEQINSLDGYKRFLGDLGEDASLPFHDILRKKLNRSQWSSEPAPHFGLGLSAYTTFTSPMRKYSDLLVHRMVKSVIHQQEPSAIEADVLDNLNEAMQLIRNAQRDCELSLKCQYLENFKGERFQGTISMINHRVIGVYLEPFDIHGQIDVHNLGQFTFRQDTLQLLSDTLNFQLKQSLDVVIDHVDLRQRVVKLTLADNKQADDA